MTHTIPEHMIAMLHDRFIGNRAASDTPTVYCMAGIPGSGKSTYVDAAIACGDFPANAFILNPDRVMEALPAYHDDVATLGAVAAFERWEMPCRTLAYDLLDRAAASRLNIIKDMGCARVENYDMLVRLKSSGYRLHMVHLDCPVDLALARIQTRARHTPATMVRERAASLAALLPQYRALADHFSEITILQKRAA
ncbi:AAA family ATPase [Micavibrio aeruginosavorus]|uniref:AAA family ATPase n=1 Tax=Micavibrio aeruginosavorus TaxID=349221 RepID=UPI003F4AD75D